MIRIKALTEAVGQRCSVEKGVLSNCAKFTGKRLCQSFFFNKVEDLRPEIFKNTFSYRTIPVATSALIKNLLINFKGAPSSPRQFLTIWNPLETMKYVLYLALFVLKIFKFLSWIFVRKLRLILKFLTSQTGKQIITINILPNFSRSKSNQKIKFVQSIEFNMRNIFLANHTQNMMDKLFAHPFLKNLNQWSKVLYVLFLL